MKKRIAYIAFALLFCIGLNTVHAQNGLQLKLGYNANIPTGSFKDFMGKNSYRGFNGELSMPVSPQLRLGLAVSSSDYYERFDRQVFPGKEGDISAVMTNSIQATPVLFKAEYTLIPKGFIRPYIEAGAGGNFVSFSQYLGEFTNVDETHFKLALSGGVGVNIPFNKTTANSGIKVGGNYNYMPLGKGISDNLNNIGIHAGVYFPL